MRMLRLGCQVLLLWCLGLGSATAQLAVPALSARVMDQTSTLSVAQREALNQQLAAFEAEAGPQIVVLMVPSTQPEDIASYAQRVADTWKIGRREVGDGVLIVVALNDRRVRIEVAKALEGAVPDLAARQIIDRSLKPAFKAGDFAGGLGLAVTALSERIKGEHLPEPDSRPASGGDQGFEWEELAVFFFVAVPIIGTVLTALFGRKLGSLLTSGAVGAMGWWFSASLLIAGGAGLVALLLVGLLGIGSARRGGLSASHGGGPVIWGGGGGDGGFSSGGGGDFGGGGASGDW